MNTDTRSALTPKFHLRDALLVHDTLYRPNLKIVQMRRSNSLERDVAAVLNVTPAGTKSLWFVNDAKSALHLHNILVDEFHFTGSKVFYAALSKLYKSLTLLSFQHGETEILIATIAFGMGCDIRDIRLVVHFAIPNEMCDYIQEIGRGGRDGGETLCLALISSRTRPPAIEGWSDDAVRKGRCISRSDLSKRFIYERGSCLHLLLLRAAGEPETAASPFDWENGCGDRCSNCLGWGLQHQLDDTARVLPFKKRKRRALTGSPSLMAKLKVVRDQIAAEMGVQPYLVASNGDLQLIMDDPEHAYNYVDAEFFNRFQRELDGDGEGGEVEVDFEPPRDAMDLDNVEDHGHLQADDVEGDEVVIDSDMWEALSHM